MFTLVDEREQLYQWDLNRQIAIEDETITEVHFANEKSKEALVTEVVAGKAEIPNILLQENEKYLYVYGVDVNFTKWFEKFPIIARAKPGDYIYTETKVKDLDDLEERVKQLEDRGILDEIALEVKALGTDVEAFGEKIDELTGEVSAAKTLAQNNNSLISQNTNKLEQVSAQITNLPDNTSTINTINATVTGISSNVANQAASLSSIIDAIDEVKEMIGEIENGSY